VRAARAALLCQSAFMLLRVALTFPVYRRAEKSLYEKGREAKRPEGAASSPFGATFFGLDALQ